MRDDDCDGLVDEGEACDVEVSSGGCCSRSGGDGWIVLLPLLFLARRRSA